jgi:hypothetical protein
MRMRIRGAVAAGMAALTAAAGVATAAAAMSATAATAGCSVAYSVTSQWPGGFNASISLTNLGSPLTRWTLTWTFAAGQQVTQAWNATVTQSGAQVTAVNASYDGSLATNGSTSLGFNGSWNNSSNPAPASFALNGVSCTGSAQTSPSTTPTPTTSPGVHTMGYIGCSMGQNTAQGYAADGGTRMWGPYATGGDVVQSWTDPNSSAWQLFDQQAAMFGKPTAVWVQVCVFTQGATIAEVDQMIANTRLHAAPGVTIFITGQPQYDPGHVCPLAGASGPALTDSLAQQAAADPAQDVTYKGTFHLSNSEVVADGCHANTAGMADLGEQALSKWG